MKAIFRTILGALAVACFLLSSHFPAQAKGNAEHVVVFVWDGMRPDFITPQYTPTLWELARQGVFFKNHHPVYLSATEVNGTALATGMYPEHSGIYANSDYRPELGFLAGGATESIDTIRRGDMWTNGKFLKGRTVAEILQAAGYPTIIAGTKPVVILHDRSNKRAQKAAAASVNLYKGRALPSSFQDAAKKANEDKGFPTNTIPNEKQDQWTLNAVLKGYWKKSVPKYTLIWMSDPDFTQHDSCPGSDQALTCLWNNDNNLGEILKVLDEKKLRDKTDIIMVSDHGFSTVQRGPDVVEFLKRAKFKATRKFEDPEPGEILVVGHGGSSSFYVVDHDTNVIAKLVGFLQGTDFAGVIFSKLRIEGTFPMEQGRIAVENGPDVVVSFRWTMDKNSNGAPGMIYADQGGRGKGSHASLSASDMHNTLVAAGPDFKKGMVNTKPSGNVDIAPTVLYLLGVAQPSENPMDGRVLHEALVSGKEVSGEAKTWIEEKTRDLGIIKWRQYLKISEYGGVTYFDEGNGEAK